MIEYPRVIGVSGYARSGKDTIANILVGLYGYHRVSFADALKNVAHDSRAIIPTHDGRLTDIGSYVDEVGWEFAKDNAVLSRELLVGLGNAARTYIHEDVWVDAAFFNAPRGRLWVVSDVRYANEYDRIYSMGGQVWRVSRPGVGPASDHISEVGLDNHDFDLYLDNDGTVQELIAKVMRQMDGVSHA